MVTTAFWISHVVICNQNGHNTQNSKPLCSKWEIVRKDKQYLLKDNRTWMFPKPLNWNSTWGLPFKQSSKCPTDNPDLEPWNSYRDWMSQWPGIIGFTHRPFHLIEWTPVELKGVNTKWMPATDSIVVEVIESGQLTLTIVEQGTRHFAITLPILSTNVQVVLVLVNSEVNGNFISPHICWKSVSEISEIQKICIHSFQIQTLDGGPIGGGSLIHCSDPAMLISNHCNNHVHIVLSFSWRQNHNSQMSWAECKITHWSPNCHQSVPTLGSINLCWKSWTKPQGGNPAIYQGFAKLFIKAKASKPFLPTWPEVLALTQWY